MKGALGAARALVVLPLVLVMANAASFRAATRVTGTLSIEGEGREYLVHVPKGYDPKKPVPLVLSMHGAGLWPAAQRDISRWDEVADEQGILVVYPAGKGSPRVFHCDPGRRLASELEFFERLLDHLEATYTVDRARIYADGLSNGGGMAFVLSCRLADRIAAIGMVAAARMFPWGACTDRRPVPIIAFHGTEDRMAAYGGGDSPIPYAPRFPDVERWMLNAAHKNRCAEDPTRSTAAPDVTRAEYGACAENASVVLYTFRGAGHTWPGGKHMPEWFVGKTSMALDATREEWAFFRAHPMPPRTRD